MNPKRYIALMLCALYVAATAGAALASVTCGCLGMKPAGEIHHRALCSCHADRPAADCHVRAAEMGAAARENPVAGPFGEGSCDGLFGCSCDCDLHSTEIDLYTSSHSDDGEKAVKCAVSELPPSMAAEVRVHVSLSLHHGIHASGPDPRPLEGVRAVAGLRAPPVAA